MTRIKSFRTDGPLLYLIATPIGNLQEFSPRALDILTQVDVVAAEDTRNASFLLKNFGIKKELFSLREHNEKEGSKHLVELLKNGKKVAYMSDAGYPGISDPGYLLVNEVIANDIPVSTVSGSSAFLNALVASGLQTNHFFYYGFLSAKDSEAVGEISSIKNLPYTVIFYEAPHRIGRTIKLLFEILGNRRICLARELTKINEEYIRGNLEELVEIDDATIKGEIVLLIEGKKDEVIIDDDKIIERVNYLISLGLTKKDAINVTAEEFSLNKNYVKKLVLF
ncbi:MAG: 16S rRNA (cytidine(1402)-2'-O)-methyltransferase [Erysipelotrichaceae bacterium]|nr:16S rRNA (cytidine(1402)-2'-O)-methyltransferase [Erysipelotrichaceae bacterium]